MKNAGPCHRCKCEMWIPDALYEAAKHGRGQVSFYCGYGHAQVFAVGESEETKLRRERDRLKQENARLEEETSQARVVAEKAQRAEKRLKKRMAAGTCPCCQRTFSNMATHMKRQHPEFVQETGATVIPIRQSASK